MNTAVDARRSSVRAAVCCVVAAFVSVPSCSVFDPSASEVSAHVDEWDAEDLAKAKPPEDWQSISGTLGLTYSIPQDWAIFSDMQGEPSENPQDAYPENRSADLGMEWGSGFVTVGNSAAQLGYCPSFGTSFRVYAGVTSDYLMPAQELARSAVRALTGSIDRRFTAAGAEFGETEPTPVSVSGQPAYWTHAQGLVKPPLRPCTPPTIAIDVVSVELQQGHSAAFLMMSDVGEEGTEDPAILDAVVRSVRLPNQL